MLDPREELGRWLVLLAGNGVFYTTPVAFRNRLGILKGMLAGFDLSIFDEIDVSLTVDELEERRDLYPALRACMEAGLPIVGFTGTALTAHQLASWTDRGFEVARPDVPADWLPFTRVRFLPVHDRQVVLKDAEIRLEISRAVRQLEEELKRPITWLVVKKLVLRGHRSALQIFRCVIQRLELFETVGNGAKRGLLESLAVEGPVVVMSRFHETAETVAAIFTARGVGTAVAHGGMARDQISDATEWFREQSGPCVLSITRELGGRGLDFPNAQSLILLSPRANYQAVMQELARIRSRNSAPKTAAVLYFQGTEEQAKAQRLARSLREGRYGERRTFELGDAPGVFEALTSFASRNLRNEESMLASDRRFLGVEIKRPGISLPYKHLSAG